MASCASPHVVNSALWYLRPTRRSTASAMSFPLVASVIFISSLSSPTKSDLPLAAATIPLTTKPTGSTPEIRLPAVCFFWGVIEGRFYAQGAWTRLRHDLQDLTELVDQRRVHPVGERLQVLQIARGRPFRLCELDRHDDHLRVPGPVRGGGLVDQERLVVLAFLQEGDVVADHGRLSLLRRDAPRLLRRRTAVSRQARRNQ